MLDQPTGLDKILDRILTEQDKELGFIIAGVLNLYHLALTRRAGRRSFLSEDIPPILEMVSILLSVNTLEKAIASYAPKAAEPAHD
jgi:hypothetical protein